MNNVVQCCATCKFWWKNLWEMIDAPIKSNSRACALDSMIMKYDESCKFWKDSKK